MKSKQEQVDIIKNIMAKHSPVPDPKMTVGKYKGERFDSVLKRDKSYILWAYNSDLPMPKTAIKYIEEKLI